MWRKFNLPKRTRDARKHINTRVRENVIDIRKVDKRQMVLVIDYSQRELIEENNIYMITSVCDEQLSKWEQNRDFLKKSSNYCMVLSLPLGMN